MKRLISETVNQSVNEDTGEVITSTTTKTYSIKTDVDKFYITFVDFMKPYLDLKYALDTKLICKLSSIAEYNTGKIVISSELREDIITELVTDPASLSRSIKRLVEKGLLTGQRGSYIINPLVFWKGDIKTRKELLKNKKLSININFEN